MSITKKRFVPSLCQRKLQVLSLSETLKIVNAFESVMFKEILSLFPDGVLRRLLGTSMSNNGHFCTSVSQKLGLVTQTQNLHKRERKYGSLNCHLSGSTVFYFLILTAFPFLRIIVNTSVTRDNKPSNNQSTMKLVFHIYRRLHITRVTSQNTFCSKTLLNKNDHL